VINKPSRNRCLRSLTANKQGEPNGQVIDPLPAFCNLEVKVMMLTKSLLLGTSAALLAVAGAQAADLPSRKAAPVEYVRVCDAYGAGVYQVSMRTRPPIFKQVSVPGIQ
jgi:hypothetical protein